MKEYKVKRYGRDRRHQKTAATLKTVLMVLLIAGACAAVDEGVPVVQRGAVMQHFLPPIHRLISGESRSPSIDKHDFSGVRQYLEVISAIRRELRDRKSVV